MQSAKHCQIQRRTTAASLKQDVLTFLATALPEGWISQPLASEDREAAADILIISPRGRCHFLFVQAPADRWWDGGPRSVPAERFPVAGVCLARKLRAAGHKARAIWGAKDLARALEAWGCPLRRSVRLGAPPLLKPRPPAARPARRVLRLNPAVRQADA
ncbi:MAG: hypothetical protein ACFCUT_09105 [Kiloniellaceae bacterium]